MEQDTVSCLTFGCPFRTACRLASHFLQLDTYWSIEVLTPDYRTKLTSDFAKRDAGTKGLLASREGIVFPVPKPPVPLFDATSEAKVATSELLAKAFPPFQRPNSESPMSTAEKRKLVSRKSPLSSAEIRGLMDCKGSGVKYRKIIRPGYECKKKRSPGSDSKTLPLDLMDYFKDHEPEKVSETEILVMQEKSHPTINPLEMRWVHHYVANLPADKVKESDVIKEINSRESGPWPAIQEQLKRQYAASAVRCYHRTHHGATKDSSIVQEGCKCRRGSDRIDAQPLIRHLKAIYARQKQRRLANEAANARMQTLPVKVRSRIGTPITF